MAGMRTNVKVSEGGRIVIPADVRKAKGIKEGDTLVLEVKADGMELRTRSEGLERARRLMAPYVQAGSTVVEDFLTDRHREADA